MPRGNYTKSKGLIQEPGEGFVNGMVTNPSVTTKAGGTLAVPLTASTVTMTTGGTEALTLADGYPGQLIHLHLASDGGNGTLTPDTKTGWATIVFADAGDRATLLYVDDSIGWIIVSLSGVSAPPTSTV